MTTPAGEALDSSARVRERVRGLVRGVFASVPWPQVTIGINPRGVGLVGLPSLYWVQGYDGRGFGASDSAEVDPEVDARTPLSVVPADDPRRQPRRLTVEVRVQPPRAYTWTFGDGTSVVVPSLGRPYSPDGPRSEIQHVYEYSSFYHREGFPVSMEASFAVSYSVSVDGSVETYDLGTTPIRFSRAYPVQEIQGVLLPPNTVLRR